MLIHPQTLLAIEELSARAAHTVFIDGTKGSGGLHIASLLCAKILQVEESKLATYPYYQYLAPVASTVGIDSVRDLQKNLILRVPLKNTNPITRAVIIDHADSLTNEAQNALLKTIEEPPSDTVIVMVGESKKMLATVLSRSRLVTVFPVTKILAVEYYSQEHDTADIEKAYYMSGGKSELLYNLLLGTDSSHKNIVEEAKMLLSTTIGDRLIKVDDYSKDKDHCRLLVLTIASIMRATAHIGGRKNSSQNTARAVRIMSLCDHALKQLETNTSVKLVLDNLFVQM